MLRTPEQQIETVYRQLKRSHGLDDTADVRYGIRSDHRIDIPRTNYTVYATMRDGYYYYFMNHRMSYANKMRDEDGVNVWINDNWERSRKPYKPARRQGRPGRPPAADRIVTPTEVEIAAQEIKQRLLDKQKREAILLINNFVAERNL